MNASAVSASGMRSKRLGEAHQDHAFVRREAVFVHEGVDAGVIAFLGARREHEAARHIGNTAAFVFGKERALDQRADETLLVHQILRRKLVPGGKTVL